jgi:DNA-binding NarL/FixJ family response regulator
MIYHPRVLVADDHKMFCEGLVGALEPTYRVVAMVHDGSQVLDEIERLKPDLALVDVSMPGQSGIDVARRMKKLGSPTKVIILTMHDEALFAMEAMRASAAGFVLKHSPRKVLLTAIEKALEGETFMDPAMAEKLKAYSPGADAEQPTKGEVRSKPWLRLTERQLEVLHHLVLGSTIAETAEALGLTEKAIEFHRRRVKKILGVSTTPGLIHYTVSHHIFD